MYKIKMCAKSIMEHQYVCNMEQQNSLLYNSCMYITFLENIICFYLYHTSAHAYHNYAAEWNPYKLHNRS